MKDRILCNLPDNIGRKVWIYINNKGDAYVLIDGKKGELKENISESDRRLWVALLYSTNWSNIKLTTKEQEAIYKLVASWDLEHKREYSKEI